MRSEAQARLAELQQEYVLGEAQLRELVAQQSVLRETLLRISGAVQVLEELLGQSDGAAGDGAGPADRDDVLSVP